MPTIYTKLISMSSVKSMFFITILGGIEMRKATLINQDWLRSKTMALAGEVIENIAFRLLLISDDFGRFPDDSEGLRVMMNDVRHTPEQIKEAIDYLVDARTVERYVVRHDERHVGVCCWARWDDYQNIKWHDDAKYPDIDGEYELSNNPRTVAKRADRRNVQRTVKRHVPRHVERTVPQKEKEKEEEKEKEDSDSDKEGKESESESRAGARELSNDTSNDTLYDTSKEKEDDDEAENASLLEREELVREIFPLLKPEKYGPHTQAIQELEADYDLPTIRRVCKWAIKDTEFYTTKFITFAWLLDSGSGGHTHFHLMKQQFESRGGGDGEPPKQWYLVGPYVCPQCGGTFRVRTTEAGKEHYEPKPEVNCPEGCKFEGKDWIPETAKLADDWTITPVEEP